MNRSLFDVTRRGIIRLLSVETCQLLTPACHSPALNGEKLTSAAVCGIACHW
jgi:hypothetical protein